MLTGTQRIVSRNRSRRTGAERTSIDSLDSRLPKNQNIIARCSKLASVRRCLRFWDSGRRLNFYLRACLQKAGDIQQCAMAGKWGRSLDETSPTPSGVRHIRPCRPNTIGDGRGDWACRLPSLESAYHSIALALLRDKIVAFNFGVGIPPHLAGDEDGDNPIVGVQKFKTAWAQWASPFKIAVAV
jgi:hypothetical protein